MIDIDVLVNARPDVEPLTSTERERLTRDIFENAVHRSETPRHGIRNDSARRSRRNVAAVAAAGVIVVGGLVAIGTLRSDPDLPVSSNTSPTNSFTSSQPPSPTDVLTSARTLNAGATGDDVVELQQQLRDLGFDPGAVNGTFGVETTSAVWAFERLVLRRQPERVTGDVTPETWEAIRNARPITPRRPGAEGARHIEVYLPEQVVVLFDGQSAVLIGPISSGALDASGQPAAFCETTVVDIELSGESLTVPSELSVCGEAYTPGGVFDVVRIGEGTHTSALATMSDPIFFNYGIAIYGTSDLSSDRSTHGGIATPTHLAAGLADAIDLDTDVLVWDGVHEPEDQDDADKLPMFPRPDPNITTPTTQVEPAGSTAIPISGLAIGDSIMVDAGSELAAAGFMVDAAAGRQFADVVEILAPLRAAGRLGDVVVLSAVEDGPVDRATADRVMTELADVGNVIILTSSGDHPWTTTNNALIYELAIAYPNVTLADWQSLHESCRGDCFDVDGVHLRPDGQQFFAEVIAGFANF